MPNKPTKEVINGVAVVRFNGNNCTGSREGGSTLWSKSLRKAPVWVQQKAKAQALRRKQAEAVYKRRYLGG